MEFIIRQTVDLARENPVLHYAQPLEYGDAGAHRWMVTINKDGAQADLGAMSAKCYVTRAASDAERAQGVTSVMVAQNAEIDAKAGTVSCVFKAACYGGVGAVSAIMRLSDASGATVTSAKLTARLDRNTSDTVCDPEGLVLSLDELLAQIDAMEAATAAAKTATTNANTATGKANAATTNANNAANNAKTQAEAAKSAAAAANAAAKNWGDSTAANSEKLGGKAPEYYIQPRNLLDNSDFTKPVNQRGNTSYSGNTYTIDRWYTYSSAAKIVLNTGYITIQNSALMQKVDTDPDKTYTAAVCKADGSVIVVTGTFSGGFGYVDIGIRCGISSGYPRFLMEPALGDVKWAALYEGSYTEDTLPPYVPKGYAAELAECQRYYQIRSANNIAAVDMRPTMRITNPTIVSVPGGYAYSADL